MLASTIRVAEANVPPRQANLHRRREPGVQHRATLWGLAGTKAVI
jgi:hypothetical protein